MTKLEIKEVYENIYMTIFPLTGNPLKSINIYTIKYKDQSLIIDTGFNNEENKKNMEEMIERLDLDLSKTRLFLTHLHSDHVGLSKHLENLGISKIYLSEVDGKILENGRTKEGSQWQNIIKNAKFQGLMKENLKIEDHPGYKNRPQELFAYQKIKPGDNISIGDFNFVCIDEAGHTPGMLGLLEKDKKILFCGDHILGKISPNITYWGDEYGDSLGIYLENIKKVKDLDIKYLYSSHRFLIDDTNKRIDELISHHKERLENCLKIIKDNPGLDTTEITQKMNWDIRAKNWDDFPSSQKWFAVSEASAHIKYLLKRQLIKEEIKNQIGYYYIKF